MEAIGRVSPNKGDMCEGPKLKEATACWPALRVEGMVGNEFGESGHGSGSVKDFSLYLKSIWMPFSNFNMFAYVRVCEYVHVHVCVYMLERIPGVGRD